MVRQGCDTALLSVILPAAAFLYKKSREILYIAY